MVGSLVILEGSLLSRFLLLQYYKDKHEKLAFLSNNLIEDIPRSLKDAESVMAPLPEDVENFLKLCRTMVDRFREDICKRA